MARKSLLNFLETTVWPDITNRSSYAKYKLQLWIILTLVLLAFFAATAAWFLFGPLKPDASRERRAAAKVCAEALRDELRENRGDARTMTCVPFVGDSTDAIFTTTMETLSSAGTFDVRGLSPINRVRRFLGLSFPASDDAKLATRKARRAKSDVALTGSVRRFEQTEDGVDLVLEYRLIDAKSGVEVYAGTYDSKAAAEATEEEVVAEPTGGNVASKTAVVPLTATRAVEGTTTLKGTVSGRLVLSDATRSRFFAGGLWVLAALAIPIVSFRFLESAAAKRSNGANLFALCVCLAADALCAWLFVAPTLRSWRSWLGVVAMAIFALWYDVQVLHLAHRRTETV